MKLPLRVSYGLGARVCVSIGQHRTEPTAGCSACILRWPAATSSNPALAVLVALQRGLFRLIHPHPATGGCLSQPSEGDAAFGRNGRRLPEGLAQLRRWPPLAVRVS